MKVKLSEWGKRVGLRLPKAVVAAAGLQPGDEFEMEIQGRELRLKPAVPVKHYRLEDLLAEMDRLGPDNRPELVDWGPDVGAEIIDDAYAVKSPWMTSCAGRPIPAVHAE
jgi:antitoxin MazE